MERCVPFSKYKEDNYYLYICDDGQVITHGDSNAIFNIAPSRQQPGKLTLYGSVINSACSSHCKIYHQLNSRGFINWIPRRHLLRNLYVHLAVSVLMFKCC